MIEKKTAFPANEFLIECVGVHIVMVCPWTDHILARTPLLEVEVDLPEGGNFPTRFSLINLESNE